MREWVCKRCGTFNRGVPRCERCCALPPVRSDSLFDVLVAIVNTAQTCPDRCMADVCNDNFAVHGVNLRAEMTDDEDTPVRIEKTSNNCISEIDRCISEIEPR
jgi:hypothetical protein